MTAPIFSLELDEKRALLRLARACVESHVRTGMLAPVPEDLVQRFPHLQEPRACFVTLHKRGELRGCIGSLEPRRPLVEDIRQNAVSAAIYDTRFEPVTEAELAELHYEISVLDVPRPLEGIAKDDLPGYLGQHKPGVIIEYMRRRSTFLPSVWEDLPDPQDFLAHLCRKQGSSHHAWREPSAKISTYAAIHFGESEIG